MSKGSVFITTAVSQGGASVSDHELNALKKTTNVIAVLDPEGPNSINPLNAGLPNLPVMWDYMALERLIRLDQIVDIIFINGETFGHTVNYAKRRWGTNVIIDVPAHEQPESVREHQDVWHYDYYNAYPHMHPDSFLWELQIAHRNLADIIICPSVYSKEAFLRLAKVTVPKEKVIVIPHGVDLPSSATPPPAHFRVGAVNLVGPDKGAPYLLKAWNQLAFKDADCMIAGQQTERLKEVAKQLEDDGHARYRFLGYRPSLDMFYNSISVLVVPSVCDGFGLCVLEAMAHKRPVIATRGTGAAELIDDGVNGFIIPIRDVEEIKKKITYFKENPSETLKFASSARKKAEGFSWQRIEEEYAKVIQGL